MAGSASLLQQLDSQLEQLFAGWNIYTTIICLGLITYLVYPLFFTPEPDTHPFLLARQSSTSPVRQPGESAIYRSLDTPYGYPLKTGLNVKDPGAPKWTSGRDGDLRDVWRQALKGPTGEDGNPSGVSGKVLTILGREEVIEYGFPQLTKEINAIGEYVTANNGARVAIYLPNSVEFLVTFFASAFYGFTPILIPQGQSLETLALILKNTKADMLVAAAGALPLEGLLNNYRGLKQVIWVAERTNRHMEWDEIPEGVGGRADIAVWHDIIDEKGNSGSSEPPTSSTVDQVQDIIMVWQANSENLEAYELVEITQKNIVAGIAAQISILPRTQRFGRSDILLPLDSLSLLYPLTVTLAALFSNASIALTSVSGPTADYSAAFLGVSPTVIIASEKTMSRACKDKKAAVTGVFHKMSHSRQARSLGSGIMPKPSTTITNPSPRLIFMSHHASETSQPLSSSSMSDLRILTGARIVYALSYAKVAGAITQLNIFDYRIAVNPHEASHFGSPLSCLEIKFKDSPDHKIQDDANPTGWLIASGPAVVGGEANLGVIAGMNDDNTLRLL